MFARKSRYAAAYTAKTPSRDPELRLLVEWIAAQDGDGLLFVGPRSDSLDNSELAAALVKRRSAEYSSWKNKGWWSSQRIIALWPNDKTLQQLDDAPRLTALGVLTWTEKEVGTWARAVSATDLLGDSGAPAQPTISDPVVLGAMRALTNSVNLSTGLAHPSDWDHAVTSLRALRERGHHVEGEEIETWALSVGWTYRHAADLGRLVTDIAAGKAKRTKSGGPSRKPGAKVIAHWAEIGAQTDWEPF